MNAQPARSSFGIGEVLAQLRADFPDISVSKIRFLEAEGLIEPARSPSGYRRFKVADVDRLRYILTAQRDQYLPLRVIKERLRPDGDAAAPSAAAMPGSGTSHAGTPHPGTTHSGAARSGPEQAASRSAMFSRRELLEAAGIDDGQLSELEAFGLVQRVGRQYGQDALEIARTVGALAGYGVQARHLRSVRAAAERETSLIEQVVAPTLRHRQPGARQQAGQTAREIAALSLRLHRALLEAALAEAGFAGDGLPAVLLAAEAPVSTADMQRPDRMQQPDRTQQPGGMQQPDRMQRPDRMQQPDRMQRPDRMQQPDREVGGASA
jgi:DNA-binding transcriptional MerR regulator